MNEILIKNHNECVQNEDTVYYIGDFALKMSIGRVVEILNRLNGKKCFLVGNHDRLLCTRDENFQLVTRYEIKPFIQWIKDYHELIIQDPSANRKQQLITMCHYAMRVWNKSHWGSWNLFGHSHGSLPDDPKALAIDVGVDAVAKRNAVGGVINPKDYRPISYDEVKVIMASKQFTSIDHYNNKDEHE